MSELNLRLREMIDTANADHEPVMVTGDRGEATAVLMSAEDFTSLEETAYLLRSPRNAERLLGAIADLDSNGGTERDLAE